MLKLSNRGLDYFIILMKGKDKKSRKQKVEPCEVCRENIFDNEVFEKLVCHQCSRVVHKNCYLPQFKEKDKLKFKCDECKKNHGQKGKTSKYKCIVCRKQNGIMKEIGNNDFIHILCALSTPRIRLTSYKSLSFTIDPNQKQLKVNNKTKCTNCHSEGSPGLQCQVKQCSKYLHLDCVISYKYKQEDLENAEDVQTYPTFTTIGLLDKHQNSLLVHIKNLNIRPSFKSLKLINIEKNEIKYLVCELHNNAQYFVWCTCNKVIEQEQVECEKCKRWFHKDCMKGQKDVCKGCITNDIYRKNARFPELIQKVVEIEGNNKVNKTIIKFLDHFCLKLSENLIEIIEKNIFEVQRYYLRKVLEQNIQYFENKHPQISKNIIKPLQILYYLCKKQLKQQKQIHVQQIQQILTQLKKSSTFEFNDKTQKIQKKYKAYVQAKRDNILKDDSHEVKYKLQEFNKKINTNNQLISQEAAKQLSDIVKLLDNNQPWKQIYLKNNVTMNVDISKHLLECFYELKLSQDDAFQFLSVLKIIALSKNLGSMAQSQYNGLLMHQFKSLADNKRRTYREIIENLLNSVRIVRQYEQRCKMMNTIEQKLVLIESTNFSSIRDEIIKNNLMFSQESNYFKLQTSLIKIEILKKQIKNKCEQLREGQLQQLIQKIKRLLEMGKSLSYLNDKEVSHYEHLINKLKFYIDLITFSNRYKFSHSNHVKEQYKPRFEVMEEEYPEDYMYEAENVKPKDKLYVSFNQKIENIIKNWPFYDENAIVFGLEQLYILTRQNVQFQEESESVLLFMQSIIEFYNTLFKQNKLMFSTLLVKKLNSLIIYSKSQKMYDHFIRMYEDFCKWKQVLEKRFFNVELVLENQSENQQLLVTLDNMLNTAHLLRVNVANQCKKMHSMKMWALLSEKIFGHQKITITAAQQIKSIMDKIRYPKNTLRSNIQRLQVEARSINKEISSFLQKNKQQQMQIYQEMGYMKSKMLIAEGQILQEKLQSCPLDVEVELQELIEQIKEYKSFAKDNIINKIQNHDSLEFLLSLRRKILQNAFFYPNLEHYEKLLVKINQIKVSQFDGESIITKKQYFKLLNHAGEACVEFFKNTHSLYKAYKDIEVAEGEILNGKPKWELLLPSDCKKIRNQLKNDPNQRSKVERWFSISQKLKERYRFLRNGKNEMIHYVQLEGQLSRLPLNNKDIISDINLLKREQGELLLKVKSFMEQISLNPELLQIENYYNSDIIQRYRRVSIKNHVLDKFQYLYSKNKEIMELGRNINIDNYKKFTFLCKEASQLQKNNEVLKMRSMAFEKMKHVYITSADPFIEVGYALLAEAGILIGRYPQRTAQIILDLEKINQKFDAWENNNHYEKNHDENEDEINEEDLEIEIDGEDEQNQNQNDDQEEQEDDYEDLASELDDFDEDDEEQDEKGQKKRPFPGGDVVQLDD